MIKCALLGYGYWGKILEKYLNESVDFELKAIYAHRNQVDVLNSIREDKTISAVFIATSIDSHFELCKMMLKAGKHVFCEKPLSKYVEEIDELEALSVTKGLAMFTDHIYLESPSIKTLLSKAIKIGTIKSFDASITQWGNFYENDGVLDVLGVHIINVLLTLLPDFMAEEIEILKEKKDENGNLLLIQTILKDNGLVVHFSFSSIAETKVRKIEVIGEKGSICVDLMSTDNVIVISQSGKKIYSFDEKNNIKSSLVTFADYINNKQNNCQLARKTAKLADDIKKLAI